MDNKRAYTSRRCGSLDVVVSVSVHISAEEKKGLGKENG